MKCEIGTDLVIIGAGPAGISAALTASKFGVECLVIERTTQFGGQLKAVHSERSEVQPEVKNLDRISNELVGTTVRVVKNSIVYRINPDRVLFFTDGDTNYKVNFQCLIIATGAREHVVPFNGWTLPGVLTTGAAQRLAIQAGVSPGDRTLVSGSGPLLLLGAAHLINLGVNVIGVIEATPKGHLLRCGWSLIARDRKRVRQAFEYLRTVIQARVPYITGEVVIEAQGNGRVDSVTSVRLDRERNLKLSEKRVWDVDSVCVAHGLKPNNRIPRSIGCQMRYDPELEAFFPIHNNLMGTSIPWAYVAGEVAAIGGADKAMIEGEIAGLQVASDLGYTGAEAIAERIIELSTIRQNAQNNWGVINGAFLKPNSLSGMTQPETQICRCEEISLEILHQAVRDGDGTLKDLKLRTRIGMGMCQGRQCEHTAIHELSAVSGTPLEEIDLLAVRPPIEPIRLKNLSDWTD